MSNVVRGTPAVKSPSLFTLIASVVSLLEGDAPTAADLSVALVDAKRALDRVRANEIAQEARRDGMHELVEDVDLVERLFLPLCGAAAARDFQSFDALASVLGWRLKGIRADCTTAYEELDLSCAGHSRDHNGGPATGALAVYLPHMEEEDDGEEEDDDEDDGSAAPASAVAGAA